MSAEGYTIDIDVRFRDLDPMNHVNNAVYVTYLEHARSGYYDDVIDEPLEAVNTVIARLEVSYEAPIEGEQDVAVTVQVPELGESSIPMEYDIEARTPGEGQANVVATGKTVQVHVDGETGEAIPLPQPWRERIAEWEQW